MSTLDYTYKYHEGYFSRNLKLGISPDVKVPGTFGEGTFALVSLETKFRYFFVLCKLSHIPVLDRKQFCFPQVCHVTWNEKEPKSISHHNKLTLPVGFLFSRVYGTFLFALGPDMICKANEPENLLKTRETCSVL